MIIEENYAYLQEYYPEMLDLKIEDVRVGSYMLCLRLSNQYMGIASSEEDKEVHCASELRKFGNFTPLRITGRSVRQLFDHSDKTPLVNALLIAALNAVSQAINELKGIKIIRQKDPIDLLTLGQNKKITVVGAFHSYIKKIGMGNDQLTVLELHEKNVLPEHRQFFRPAGDYVKVLPDADVVMITGLTMVNNTFDDLLKACNPDAQIVVVGPSSNLISEVLFQKNVDIIGGIQITHPEIIFDLISQGAAGYHLFKYGAEKICILNEAKQKTQ